LDRDCGMFSRNVHDDRRLYRSVLEGTFLF